MTPEGKSKELITQFGANAKYVCLEMIDQLLILERYWANDMIDPIKYWQEVKQFILNKQP